MTIYVYIPIRSGSKGVKDKNIKLISGKRLFEWTIDFAINLTAKSNIIVSSNSEHYLSLAKPAGVKTLNRKESVSKDISTTEESMISDLLLKNIGIDFNEDDWLCLMQATSPIRLKVTAEKLLSKMNTQGVDSIIGINKQAGFHWKKISGSQYISPTYDLRSRPRRQQVLDEGNERLVENGSIYATRWKCFKKTGLRVSGSTVPLYMESIEGYEIDDEYDFEICEKILASL